MKDLQTKLDDLLGGIRGIIIKYNTQKDPQICTIKEFDKTEKWKVLRSIVKLEIQIVLFFKNNK